MITKDGTSHEEFASALELSIVESLIRSRRIDVGHFQYVFLSGASDALDNALYIGVE